MLLTRFSLYNKTFHVKIFTSRLNLHNRLTIEKKKFFSKEKQTSSTLKSDSEKRTYINNFTSQCLVFEKKWTNC